MKLSTMHDDNDWIGEEVELPEMKRNSYKFGFGKRNGYEDSNDKHIVFPIMQLGKKEDPFYAFGLGKRGIYSFGLGKKSQVLKQKH